MAVTEFLNYETTQIFCDLIYTNTPVFAIYRHIYYTKTKLIHIYFKVIYRTINTCLLTGLSIEALLYFQVHNEKVTIAFNNCNHIY